MKSNFYGWKLACEFLMQTWSVDRSGLGDHFLPNRSSPNISHSHFWPAFLSPFFPNPLFPPRLVTEVSSSLPLAPSPPSLPSSTSLPSSPQSAGSLWTPCWSAAHGNALGHGLRCFTQSLPPFLQLLTCTKRTWKTTRMRRKMKMWTRSCLLLCRYLQSSNFAETFSGIVHHLVNHHSGEDSTLSTESLNSSRSLPSCRCLLSVDFVTTLLIFETEKRFWKRISFDRFWQIPTNLKRCCNLMSKIQSTPVKRIQNACHLLLSQNTQLTSSSLIYFPVSAF